MTAHDKPVSKLAESPELCTGLDSLMVSEQQQERFVIPGLKTVSQTQWGSEKNQKCALRWGRKELQNEISIGESQLGYKTLSRPR